MYDRFDIDEHELESWARERDFDELSFREREIVERALGSRSEYDTLRATITATRDAFSRARAPRTSRLRAPAPPCDALT